MLPGKIVFYVGAAQVAAGVLSENTVPRVGDMVVIDKHTETYPHRVSAVERRIQATLSTSTTVFVRLKRIRRVTRDEQARAFDEGNAHTGSIAGNPYPASGIRARAWRDGWRAAKRSPRTPDAAG